MAGSKKENGFIEEYKAEILRHIPTHRDWAEAIAVSALATACNDCVVLDNIGEVRLNTGYVAVAKSSRGWKSPAMRYFLIPLLDRMFRLSGNQERYYRLPSEFSPEGMTDFLNTRSNSGISVVDEISALFKLAGGRGNSYTVQMMEYLNKLLDGQVDPRYTIGRELENLEGRSPYFCLIGATTPYIYSVLDWGIFTSGFGNRLLYIIYEPEKVTFTEEELFGDNELNLRARDDKLDEYARMLERLSNRRVKIVVKVGTEASKRITDYRNELEDRADKKEQEGNTGLANYISKVSIYIFKLSGLHSISKNIDGLTSRQQVRETTLQIDREDADWAIERVEKYIESFDIFISNWQTKVAEKPPESHRLEYESVINTIKNNADGLATIWELSEKLGWVPIDGRAKGLSPKYKDLLDSAIALQKIAELSFEEKKALPEDVRARHKIDISVPKPKRVFRLY